MLSGINSNKSGRKVADEDSKSLFFDLFDVHIRKTGKIKYKKWLDLVLSWGKSNIEEAMGIFQS